MRLAKLQLTDFRNYKKETVEFDPGVNILTGKNGEGKTNLVEAVYLLSMGRSFRTNIDPQMIRFEAGRMSACGDFERDDDPLSIEVRLAGRQKSILIDGIEHRKTADLQGLIYTVLFSPEDLRITYGEPEHRRRFMDRELFQIKPLYYLDVVRYKRIIRNRNLLLKEPVLNENLLDIYDGYLAETGARIMTERAGFAKLLNKVSGEVQSRITDGSEELQVFYEPGIARGDSVLNSDDAIGDDSAVNDEGKSDEDIETGTLDEAVAVTWESAAECRDLLLETVRSRREKDLEKKVTSVGPHRDDLKLVSGGIDLRSYGSRGQQRTAALALKLAELEIIEKETGHKAILLLDDVLSELDEDRQRQLIGAFEGHQILLTATGIPDEILQAFPGKRVFEINDGHVTEKPSE